jgi:hypothetical protein
VLVAPLQGPDSLTQLEPAPQKTSCAPLQAALAIVLQAPVVVLMQHPVACALTRAGSDNDNDTTVARTHTIGPSITFSTRFDIITPVGSRPYALRLRDRLSGIAAKTPRAGGRRQKGEAPAGFPFGSIRIARPAAVVG